MKKKAGKIEKHATVSRSSNKCYVNNNWVKLTYSSFENFWNNEPIFIFARVVNMFSNLVLVAGKTFGGSIWYTLY